MIVINVCHSCNPRRLISLWVCIFGLCFDFLELDVLAQFSRVLLVVIIRHLAAGPYAWFRVTFTIFTAEEFFLHSFDLCYSVGDLFAHPRSIGDFISREDRLQRLESLGKLIGPWLAELRGLVHRKSIVVNILNNNPLHTVSELLWLFLRDPQLFLAIIDDPRDELWLRLIVSRVNRDWSLSKFMLHKFKVGVLLDHSLSE